MNIEQKCKKCGSNNVDYIADGCSCHLDAPCSGCENAPLVCKDCNHKEYIEYEYEPVSQIKTEPYIFKTRTLNDLKKGEFNYISKGMGRSSWCEIKGYYNEKEDTMKTVKEKLGISHKYCMTQFKVFANGYFNLTYVTD